MVACLSLKAIVSIVVWEAEVAVPSLPSEVDSLAEHSYEPFADVAVHSFALEEMACLLWCVVAVH